MALKLQCAPHHEKVATVIFSHRVVDGNGHMSYNQRLGRRCRMHVFLPTLRGQRTSTVRLLNQHLYHGYELFEWEEKKKIWQLCDNSVFFSG